MVTCWQGKFIRLPHTTRSQENRIMATALIARITELLDAGNTLAVTTSTINEEFDLRLTPRKVWNIYLGELN